MFWKRWFEKDDDGTGGAKCCKCGGIIMRQTTLDEFGFEFLHPGQRRLTEWGMTTERVGMGSEKRKYRGNI